jgi:hypothetical protein
LLGTADAFRITQPASAAAANNALTDASVSRSSTLSESSTSVPEGDPVSFSLDPSS